MYFIVKGGQIFEVLQEYRIYNKTICITTNNATSRSTMAAELNTLMGFKHEQCMLGYMPHPIHCIRQLTAFLKQSTQKLDAFSKLSKSFQLKEVIKTFCKKKFTQQIQSATNKISSDQLLSMILATPAYTWLIDQLEQLHFSLLFSWFSDYLY
ncbi:uncharacterized protein VP01_3855g2 [Puccinia sorghi]|uniref:Uncharacterized protein n=1 Tax=Puccinia sorghi TaxID=27349 RepID=A0A0L6UTX4_9BASI|nr:uncharacterized protein VP01_3855g2 [Puccinia sorghi]